MLACAITIEQFLQKRDHSRYLYNRLYIFTGGLRTPGSAKSDARERILLAEKLPAVTEEAAQPQYAKKSEPEGQSGQGRLRPGLRCRASWALRSSCPLPPLKYIRVLAGKILK